MSSSLTRGITLVEVCVVVAIVAIVAAVLYPALVGSRRAAWQAASVQNLRQVGIALHVYKEDYGELPLNYFDPLVEAGYLKEPELLVSPCDVVAGRYGWQMARCADGRETPKWRSSFETALFSRTFLSSLKEVDARAAIVVNRTCGTRRPRTPGNCSEMPFFYWGPIARLHEDTSVKVGKFWFESWPGEANGAWDRIRLYTEQPIPPHLLPSD